MKERPILFNAQMVRAILDGRKTQTRRVVKPQPPTIEAVKAKAGIDFGWIEPKKPDRPWRVAGPVWAVRDLMGQEPQMRCPYGQPGDRLWVREAWRFEGTDMARHGRSHSTPDGVIRYLEDNSRRTINTDWRNVEAWMSREHKNRPSIHMPRWASRITLEVTGVRVERLQDISEDDALAEGITSRRIGTGNARTGCRNAYGLASDDSTWASDARQAYSALWESINGPDSWNANPWVFVVEFRRLP